MYSDRFMKVLALVAQRNNMTVQEVHDEMMSTMREGQQNSDPKVQALWNAIPRQGSELTLEEFVMYVLSKSNNPLS